MKGRKKADVNVILNVRFPKDLHRLLTLAAKEAKPKNSLNTEILVRLYRSFQREHADDLLDQAIAQHEKTKKLFNLVAQNFSMPPVKSYDELIGVGTQRVVSAKRGTKK
jgi:hypothetical protein